MTDRSMKLPKLRISKSRAKLGLNNRAGFPANSRRRKVVRYVGWVLFGMTFLLNNEMSAQCTTMDIQDATVMSQFIANECGKVDTVTYTVRNCCQSVTMTGVTMKDTLPGYFLYAGYVANGDVSGVTQSGSVLTISINNIAVGATRTIKLLYRAGCGAQSAPAQIAGLRVDATAGSPFFCTKRAQDLKTGTIPRPALQLATVGTVNYSGAVIGNTYTRVYKFTNTGLNSSLDSFTFQNILQAGLQLQSLTVNGIAVTPTTSSGGGRDTLRYGIGTDLRVLSSNPGDTIRIAEVIKVISCTNASLPSIITGYWGCGSTSQCQVAGPANANIVMAAGTTVLTRVFPSRIDNVCVGDETYDMYYKNTGTGQITDIKIDISQSYYGFGSVQNNWAYLDTASVQFRKKSTDPWTRGYLTGIQYYTASSAVKLDCGLSNNFGPSRGTLVVSVLNPGDTLFVRIKKHECCRQRNINTTIMEEGGIWEEVQYKDGCGVTLFTLTGRERANNMRYYVDRVSRIAGNLSNGNTISRCFDFTIADNYSLSSTGEFSSSKGRYRIVFKHGPAMSFAGKTVTDFKWGTNAGNWIPNRVQYNASTSTIIADFNLSSFPASLTSFNVVIPGNSLCLNLDINCGALTGSVRSDDSMYIYYSSDTTCSSCTYDLWNNVFSITQVNCPCASDGLSSQLSIKRANYGLVDADNNSVPDGSGTHNLANLRLDRVISGDTLNEILTGLVNFSGALPGTGFSNGYYEAKWQYGRRFSPIGNATVQVKDAGTGTWYTCNNATITETVLPLDSSMFKIDFSIATIAACAGLPGGFEYQNGDSIRINVKWRMDQCQSTVGGSIVLANINNVAYLAQMANPTASANKYYCYASNQQIQMVNWDILEFGNSTISELNSCGQIQYARNTFIRNSNGNAVPSVQDFPYEVRQFAYLDSVFITLPTGYLLDSVRVRQVRRDATGPYNRYTHTLVGANKYLIRLQNAHTAFGGTSMTFADECVQYNQTWYIKPSCETKNATVENVLNEYWWKSVNLLIGTNCDTRIHTANTWPLRYAKPQLTISSLTPSITAVNQIESWPVTITNTANNSDAANSFVFFRGRSGLIAIDSVRNTTTGVLLNQSGGVYQLGTLLRNNGSINLRAYAHYSACSTIDTIYAVMGYDCGGYPTSPSAACKVDSFPLRLQPTTPDVQLNILSQPSGNQSLCNTLSYVVQAVNVNPGVAYSNTFDIILPTGMSIVSGSVKVRYPGAAGALYNITPINLGAGLHRLRISDSIVTIKTNGLRPNSATPDNEYRVELSVLTDCNYISGGNISFRANYSAACGQPFPSSQATSSAINITGAPTPKLQFSISTAPNISTCGTNYTMRLVFKNNGVSASTNADHVYVNLPSGAEYTAGSASFSRNTFTSGSIPVTSIVGGVYRIDWTADGTPAADSSVWTFQINSPANISCGSNITLTVQAVTTFTAVCGAGSCNSSVQNAMETFTRPVMKPNLQYIAGTGSIILRQDTTVGNKWYQDSLMISGLKFSNSGNDTADLPIMRIFFDADNSGTYNAGDASVFLDTMPAVLPSANYTYNYTVATGHKALPAGNKYKILVTQNCNCTNNNFVAAPSMSYIPLSLNLLTFNATLQSNSMVKLNWDVLNEDPQPVYFEVSRRHEQDKNFVYLGTVKAQTKGSSNLTHYYYLDNIEKQEKGKIYYRLKIHENNSMVNYSDVVYVEKGNKTFYSVSVFPNPANTSIGIYVTGLGANSYQYSVNSVDGKFLYLNGSASSAKNTINTSSLDPGIYILQIEVDGEKLSQKIVITR